VPTTRVLVISAAGDTLVAEGLRAEQHEVTAVGDVPAAIAAAEGHEVVVLDLAGPVARIVVACRALRAAGESASIPILCVSPTDDVEDRIRLLEAGADDVVPRPFHPQELTARAEALALRYQRARDLAAGVAAGGPAGGVAGPPLSEGGHHRTIAIYSPKGGVGTTTIAVNIATWLAGRLAGGVVILDLDYQFGQVATHLNVTPRLHLGDLARDEVALHDPALFQVSLDRHESGLMVLASPPTPDASLWITEATVSSLLSVAAATHQVVVVDAGSAFDVRTETVLTQATDSVIVVTPEFPALKAVHALMEVLATNNENASETSYILNEIFARELLRPSDIEEALGKAIASTIPYDAFAFLKSVNEGVPLVTGSPDVPAAAQLRSLAARLAGMVEPEPSVVRRAKGIGGLFGRG